MQLVLDRLALFLGRLALFLDRLKLVLNVAEFGLHRLVMRFLSGLRREYNVKDLGLLVHLFLQCLDCRMVVFVALPAGSRLHVVGGCASRGASVLLR